jgi:hypothetical protein
VEDDRIMNTRKAVALLCLAAVVFLGCRGMRAQGRVSPHEKTSATVDGSDMYIEYGRPSTRGRAIFGSLVRWNEVWCPGADEATYLHTSKPLRVGSLALPAGEYSLWIQPTEDAWTLIVNREAHTFHTSYRSRSDFGRVAMEKETLPANIEQLTFTIEPTAGASGGRIAMSWATTRVSVPFAVE